MYYNILINVSKGRTLCYMDRVILIPAYQPADILVDFVKELKESSFETVVVDDGGGAAFDEIFNKVAELCTVIRYTPNLGKGAALKAGFKYIRENIPSARFVITADADGQHKIPDIIKVADALASSPENIMVIGARHFENKVPLRSKFGNTVTRFVYNVLTRQKITDTQTGLRGFHVSMLPWLESVEGDRYEYEMNVLMAVGENQIKITEVKIETIYENDNSSSHFRPFHDSVRIYKTIFLASTPLKYMASALLAFALNYGIYALLVWLLKPVVAKYLFISTLVAWVISSFVNFSVNRSVVFRKKDGYFAAFAGYYSLAVIVYFVKFGMTYVFVNLLHISEYIAMPISEVILFVVNYFVQKLLIFGKKKKIKASEKNV